MQGKKCVSSLGKSLCSLVHLRKSPWPRLGELAPRNTLPMRVLWCFAFKSNEPQFRINYTSHVHPPTIFTFLHCILFWLNLYFFKKFVLLIGKTFSFSHWNLFISWLNLHLLTKSLQFLVKPLLLVKSFLVFD
jgi:hypothetical protein